MRSDTASFRRYLITVLDNIREGVLLVGVAPGDKFPLLLANKAFHTLTGYRTDCVGKDVFEFVNPERHKFLRGVARKILKHKKPFGYAAWSNVPAGRRAFEVELIPVLNGSKEVKEVIVMVRDITTLTKLKEEVQTLRAVSYQSKEPQPPQL